MAIYFQNFPTKNFPFFCYTGSLGHGGCVALGMALAKKMNNEKGKIFTIVGDGECQEGSVWEMAMLASSKKCNNSYPK